MYEPHSKLKTPSDDEVIWRYFDLSGFLHLVSTGKLYFRRCDKFDDQWDSWYSAFPLVLNHKAENEHDRIRNIRRFLSFQEEARREYFANCWHRSSNENAAMWELYAARKQGIAVRSSIRRLKECFRRCSHKVFISEVNYGPFDQLDLADHSNGLPPLFVKRVEYRFESEVRALIWSRLRPDTLSGGEAYVEHDDVGFTCPVDVPELIESVVVSPTSPASVSAMIQSILDKFGFGQIPVKKSRLSETPPSLADYDKHEPQVFTLSLRMEKKEVEMLLKACHDFHQAHYKELDSMALWNIVNGAAHQAGCGGDWRSFE